jgi:hypothetical protein
VAQTQTYSSPMNAWGGEGPRHIWKLAQDIDTTGNQIGFNQGVDS